METLNTLDPVVNLHEELEPDNDSDNHNDRMMMKIIMMMGQYPKYSLKKTLSPD